MRIGIEAQRILRSRKHGMDVVAVELIKNLQQLDKANYYTVFCRNGADLKTIENTNNFQVKTLSAFTYADWEQLQLTKAVKRQKIELLHCTANTAPINLSVPLILTLHDIIYLETVDFKGTAYQNLGNLYRRFVVPKIAKKAAVVLTVSEFEKQNIIERLQLPEQQVQVLYNGVSPKFHNQFTEAHVQSFREELQLPEKYIMFLGNTAPKKNTHNVIKAYAAYCAAVTNPVAMVLLDYKKEFVMKLLEELKQPELISQFVFPGYVPHHQIPLMYHAATLFLYPSLRESFGLPIIEAMACGTPVITSTTSSMPEIAGDAAVLIDPFKYQELAAAITNLLQSPEAQQTYRQRGLERAKLFAWKASAQKLLSIYNQF